MPTYLGRLPLEPEKATSAMRDMMAKLKLTRNEAKTTRGHVWNKSFDFLGYTIGKCYSPVTGRAAAKATLLRSDLWPIQK
jgi:hypothetical protein